MGDALTVQGLDPKRKYSLNELTKYVFDTLNIRMIRDIYQGFQPVSDPKDHFDPWRGRILEPVHYHNGLYVLGLTTDLTDMETILSSPLRPIFFGEINGLHRIVNDINHNLTKPDAGMMNHNNPPYVKDAQNKTHLFYPIQLLTVKQ